MKNKMQIEIEIVSLLSLIYDFFFEWQIESKSLSHIFFY
jgi:hypothetical protein